MVKCMKNGLYRRHNDVVEVNFLKKLFDQAGYRTRTEVSLPSGQRPADLLVEDWEGQPLAIDVSFRHPQGSWNVDSAVQAVAAGEVEKRAQYLIVCRQHGWAFEPFILSPLGWLGLWEEDH